MRVAALSLPGAALLTLLGGAIFGVVWGTVIVSFASSIGATLSFLSSRYLFREAVQKRFGARLGAINRGIERDGGFYLVTLRLVPVFPFFAVNLLMGLTPITTRTFYVASQIGMFLVILAIVSAAIVAFIIYTLTMGKIREIAVLKLIGTRNRTIAAMIVQQAVALGLIGFVVGKTVATFWAPAFPKYVLLEPADAVRGLVAVIVICIVASALAIRAALKIDPAEAIGG